MRLKRFALSLPGWLLLPALGCAAEITQDAQRISEWFDHSTYAPLLFLMAYILAQQLFISSTMFCIAAGILFGVAEGALLAIAGASAGAAISFLISRHLVAGWLTPRLSPTMINILNEVERGGWRAVLFIRLLPVLPFTPLNYTLGLTRLSLLQFLLPTMLCVAPRIAIYAYIGQAGRHALEGRVGVLWDLIIALGVLVALTWLPHLLRKLRQ